MVTHGEFLRSATRDDALVYHLQRDHQAAPLDPQERPLLDYVTKLTLEPSAVGPADVQSLRDAGFDDRGILDIVLITAMFAFMNRLAEGLGVPPEKQFLEAKTQRDARIEARAKAPKDVTR